MTPRRISLCTLLALVALVAIKLALFRPTPGVSQAEFGRLRPGMTRAEAEQLLHGPARNGLHRAAVIWVPRGDGRRISAEIRPGEPAANFFSEAASADGEQAVWSTETGVIAVQFGQDGRLRRKYYSDVHVLETPSVFDWLSSRPGMIRQSLGL